MDMQADNVGDDGGEGGGGEEDVEDHDVELLVVDHHGDGE